MTSLLLYVRSSHQVTVLQAQDPEYSLISDFGTDLADWPEDLGAYNLNSGLWVWEGETPEDDSEWTGNFRPLNADELNRLGQHLPVFD